MKKKYLKFLETASEIMKNIKEILRVTFDQNATTFYGSAKIFFHDKIFYYYHTTYVTKLSRRKITYKNQLHEGGFSKNLAKCTCNRKAPLVL